MIIFPPGTGVGVIVGARIERGLAASAGVRVGASVGVRVGVAA
jgi:hypothetical protein